LCHTDRANRAWNPGSASDLSVADGWHKRHNTADCRGTDDISTAANSGRTIDMVPTAGNIRRNCSSRLSHTGAAAACATAAPVTFHYCSARSGAIDGHPFYIHAEHRSHDDGIGTGDVADRDGASSSVGDHSYANSRHHDRKHFASGPAWQLLDHRMQLHAGRAADQRRSFATLDAGNSGESATRYDSAGRRPAWRYQYRSDRGGYANAEHVGMRRRHDDESGDTRHDGTGQCHGRSGNTGRITGRLLTGQPP
jgi:hypothetical protein